MIEKNKSRLKFSISLENFDIDLELFDLYLENSPQKIGVVGLRLSISLENFNPGGRS